MDSFSNSGNFWSKEEDNLLLRELKDCTNINDIAENHRRTNGSIRARINKIVYEMFKQNVPILEIIEKTKLNKEKIEEIIKKQKSCDVEYCNKLKIQNKLQYLNIKKKLKLLTDSVDAIYDNEKDNLNKEFYRELKTIEKTLSLSLMKIHNMYDIE